MNQVGAGANWESRNLLPVSSQPPADCTDGFGDTSLSFPSCNVKQTAR